jgi:hypothetical protein
MHAASILAMNDELTKIAYSGELMKSCGPDGVDKGWMGQFEGTPFFEEAASLEKQQLEHDIAQNARQMAEDGKRNKEQKARDAMYKQGDLLRTTKRGLELKLALHRHSSMASAGKAKTSAELTPESRAKIPKKEFAQPGKKAPEGDAKGKYPIPDAQHYRTALGFAKMHGDTKAYAAIKAKGKAMGYGGGDKEKQSFVQQVAESQIG